jgi:4-diphosphocytidyl-2-C-methyl-D-erythritol kinase
MQVIFEKTAIFAPAKVNLHLAVKDRRKDGFHNLESIFLAVDFGDTLHFEHIPDENIPKLTMEGPAAEGLDIPAGKNIIFKAMSLFRAKTGFKRSLNVRVEKLIPAGGGLGGGSSDAASTLLVLNKMAGNPLDRSALLELGAEVGSDVPFFIHGIPSAKVTGRGDIIEPIELPGFFLVLVNPGFKSDTASIYSLLDKYRKKEESSADESEYEVKKHYKYYNDFLPVFNEPEKSTYNSIISQLRELGADFAGLSGAGSTCFGIFNERLQADLAAASLLKTWYFVKFCCPIRNLAM